MADGSHPTISPRRWLLASGCAMVLFSLAPWASFEGIAVANGLAVGFGWITLICGAAAVTIAAQPRWIRRRARAGHRRKIGLYACGAPGVLDCVLVILATPNSQYGTLLAPQWGVYLTLLCAIALLAGTRRPLPLDSNAKPDADADPDRDIG
jgi:hypothetical protein